MSPQAAIFGCAGKELTADERRFFTEADPLGFILFARNVGDPDQVRALTADLRDAVGRPDAPILIDQEGGRVARLRPPHWRAAPAAEVFGLLFARDPTAGREAAGLNAALLAAELLDLGIDVDCAPVLDLRLPEGHEVIGDRAYAAEPAAVGALARAAAEGFMGQGVTPIGKHIPGHGRAPVDSHLELPQVEATSNVLVETDFATFHELRDLPWMMTAHVVYRALDADHPATTSPGVIQDVIRGHIGFDGVLVSDDLSMQALSGDFTQRARDALSAGCDIVLHCNGDMAEMQAIRDGVDALLPRSAERLEAARTQVEASRQRAESMGSLLSDPRSRQEAEDHLDALLSGA